MKKLISAFTVVALAALCLAAQEKDHAAPAKIAGEWAISMDTPHGNVDGSLKLTQDGAKVTGNMEAEPFGKLPVTGALDGNKVELTIEIADADIKFKLSGTVDGKAMSGQTEMGGAWKAARK